MFLLCIIWGLQQVVLKAAAPDISPLLQIALRSGIAALLVGLLRYFRGERMSLSDGTWRPAVIDYYRALGQGWQRRTDKVLLDSIKRWWPESPLEVYAPASR